MAALLLAGIALQLINPQVIRYFLDSAQAGGDRRALMAAAAIFIAFALLQQGLSVMAGYTSQNVGWTATNQLRRDLLLHVLRLDMPFHKQHTPGELIERVDGDVTRMANFFSQFSVNVLANLLLIAGILALLFRENAWVGVGMLVYVVLIALVLGKIQQLAVPRWVADRQASAELYGFIEERVSGAEEIRAAGAEAHTMRRLYALMRVFLEKVRAAWVFSSLTYNMANLLYVTGYAGGLAVGVFLYTRGEASLGAAYLITYYIGMLERPMQNLREQVEDLQQAAASIQRVEGLLAEKPAAVDPGEAGRAIPQGALSVAFEQVDFGYDGGENVLHGVSFAVRPGRVLGILGRTGSGKTTLARLLFRLYDPGSGSVRLGEVDIREAGLGRLRERVGMVTQDVQLFGASLRENLTFFNPGVTTTQLIDALKTLRLWNWVQGLPGGLDTRLAAEGKGLSAGEAQLLAFTRVFLKDPGLVILDEASSRLDPATEALMEQAVDRLFAGRTGLVIAHRLKTVLRADDILILENGRVVEWGERAALAGDPSSRFAQLLRAGMEEALA